MQGEQISVPVAFSDLETEVSLLSTATSSKKGRTPLPLKKMFVLGCVFISEAFSLTMLWVFLPFMVRGFNITTDDSEIGYYAGWVGSAFGVAQFLSGTPWGYASDKLGRRPVLLLGLCGNFFAMIAFGFSTTLPWAIASRFINGLLNGNVGVARTYLCEITDDTNQSYGYSVLATVWGVGCIIGPIVGGFFSDITIIRGYPYVLPCAISSIVTALGFLAGIFFLDETLGTVAPPVTNSTVEMEKLEFGVDDEAVDCDRSREEQSSRVGCCYSYRHTTWYKFVTSYSVVVLLVLYTLIGLTHIIYDEVFSLWALLHPIEGGLDLLRENIGTALVVVGSTLIVFQLFIYPKIDDAIGPLGAFCSGAMICVPSFLLFPLLNIVATTPFPYYRVLMWALLGMSLTLRVVGASLVFNSIGVLFNNAVSSQYWASLNGVSQSFVSLARAFAPSLGGSIFAWSTESGIGFPFNFYFIWICMSAASLITFLLARTLPASLNRRCATAVAAAH